MRTGIFFSLLLFPAAIIIGGGIYLAGRGDLASHLHQLTEQASSVSTGGGQAITAGESPAIDGGTVDGGPAPRGGQPRTALGTPLASEVETSPLPSALERFRQVVEGPKQADTEPVDLPVVRKPSDLILRELRKPENGTDKEASTGKGGSED